MSKQTYEKVMKEEHEKVKDSIAFKMQESLATNALRVLVKVCGFDGAIRACNAFPGGPQVKGALIEMYDRNELRDLVN